MKPFLRIAIESISHFFSTEVLLLLLIKMLAVCYGFLLLEVAATAAARAGTMMQAVVIGRRFLGLPIFVSLVVYRS